MTRKEKRAIRLEIINLLDEKCKRCQYSRGYQNKICIEDCPVGYEFQSLSQRLLVSKKKGSVDKKIEFDPENKSKRRPWTEEEDFYLLNHDGIVPRDHLAKKMNRTVHSVNSRIQLLKKLKNQQVI
jgi:Zinc-finger